MAVTLGRIFRRTLPDPGVDPVPFGPRYSISGDRLAIESGPLAGTALRVERRVSHTKADFSFYELAGDSSPIANRQSPVSPDPVAHCHFDRDPQTGIETLWSIFIRSEYRRRGLTTLLTRLTFRGLLATGRRHWFSIRKLMQVDTEGRNQMPPPGSPRPEGPQLQRIALHNLGLGLVALRLGFKPEPDLARLLAPGNVDAIQAIPPDPPSPPGLLLRLGTLPGLLVAAMVDPKSGQPVTDASAYERFVSPKQLLRQALSGHAVIGNIDYILSRTAIEPLAARLANDHAELRHFAAALRRGAPN
ncbi:hypothetical protein FJY68_04915 [candidate division WOR-3 bacterium]|uniref:N-acetyltransferase domain-containing protein n=1 Tax=candidate division WOR-3 bacterium TaxID=2052148 RepID=A0A937XGU9_UNCW3|nr:hypothetical protein [candidate division WOR-3 bacterium]